MEGTVTRTLPRSVRLIANLALLCAFLTGEPAYAQPQPPIVIGHLLDTGGPQADLARDYMAGAKVAFDAVNQRGGIGGRRILHQVREHPGTPDQGVAAALALVEQQGAVLLFGPTDRQLPALTSATARAGRAVPIVAPLSGLALDSKHVWFTRPTYASELLAAYQRLRQFGMRRIALVTTPGLANAQVDSKLLAALGRDTSELTRYTLGDEAGLPALAKRIATSGATAVIVASDTLAYAALGRALVQQDWYGFLVGLSSVNPVVARQVIGASGGMLLTQTVPDPMTGTAPLVREHLAHMKQFLDETPSHATLAGYMAARWLCEALSRMPARAATPAEIERALRKRIDIGGIVLDFTQSQRGSEYVDLRYMPASGELRRH